MSGDLAKGSNDKSKGKWKKGKPTLKKLERRIQNVYKNIAQEIKVHDSAYTFLPDRDGSALDMYALSAIAQGDTDITRDGLKIKAKSIQVKGQVYMDNAIQSSTVRCVIFCDRNYENGVPPTCAQLFESGYFGTPSAPYSMRNRKERERFDIIYDKLFTLNNTGANTLPFNIYKRLNKVITYSSTSNSDYGKNQLWMAWISGQAEADKPTVNCVNRLSFTDS